MSSTSTHRSPAEIEREVEEARARLRGDLAEMRTRLSPGTMLDHALDYARASGGAEFTRTFGRQVRDNPLPIALIGAGIGWLMTAGRLDGASRDDALSTRRMSRGAHDGGFATGDAAHWGIGETIASAMHGVRDMANAVTGAATNAAGTARDATGHAVHAVSDAASGLAGGTRRVGGQMADGVSHGVHAAADGGAGAVDRMGRMIPRDADRRLSRAVEEQPMLLGAIGLALGAIVGGMLPATRTENRAFGDTADRVKDQASAAVQGGINEARAVARDAMHKAGDVVKDMDEAGLDHERRAEAAPGPNGTAETRAEGDRGRSPSASERPDPRPHRPM